jgi:1-deoxyxylulose-5-phosphate synthase
MSRPGVVAPIVSATRLEQLDQLIEGMAVTLSPEEVALLEEPHVPHRVSGSRNS